LVVLVGGEVVQFLEDVAQFYEEGFDVLCVVGALVAAVVFDVVAVLVQVQHVDLLVLGLYLLALGSLDKCLIDEHQQLCQFLILVQLRELVVLVQVKRTQSGHLLLQQEIQLRLDTRVGVNVDLSHDFEKVVH